MKIEHKITIIVAVIGLIGSIAAAIIGAKWGKNNVYVLNLNGQEIALNEDDIQELANDNEKLKGTIAEYEATISEYETTMEKLEGEKTDLEEQMEDISGELSETPAIEFSNLGLSIDGEEKVINSDKAMVYINGVQYYSQDFIDNLVPDNMAVTFKDCVMYIGKIVKEKANLLDIV